MIAQRNMKSFFLCNGNETQEIMKPTGAHDFCFRRFIGMFCTRKPEIFHLCSLFDQSISKIQFWQPERNRK